MIVNVSRVIAIISVAICLYDLYSVLKKGYHLLGLKQHRFVICIILPLSVGIPLYYMNGIGLACMISTMIFIGGLQSNLGLRSEWRTKKDMS